MIRRKTSEQSEHHKTLSARSQTVEVTGVKKDLNPLPHYYEQGNNCETTRSYDHSVTVVHL